MLQHTRAHRTVSARGLPGHGGVSSHFAPHLWHRRLDQAWKHLVLLVLLCVTFYPFIAMLIISGKDQSQFALSPWTVTWPFHIDYYSGAWTAINPYIFNSIIYSGTSCLGVLVLSTISAYVFARYRFAGKEFLFYLIIGLLMVPGILTLIPSFILFKDLGMINTRWALIMPYIAGGQVFGIFLLRSFFSSLPEELFEAARIDGAGDIAMLTRIVLPLSWGILATLAIFQVLATWNDLVWPSVAVSDDSLRTIVTGLWNTYVSQYATAQGPLMAGYVIASLPLLLLFAVASRYFVAGLTSGALKV